MWSSDGKTLTFPLNGNKNIIHGGMFLKQKLAERIKTVLQNRYLLFFFKSSFFTLYCITTNCFVVFRVKDLNNNEDIYHDS